MNDLINDISFINHCVAKYIIPTSWLQYTTRKSARGNFITKLLISMKVYPKQQEKTMPSFLF